MQRKLDASLEPTPEQVRYAGVMEKGMYLGLGCLFLTFAIYVFEIIERHIPPEEVPVHWTKSVHEYLADAGLSAGWNWVTMVGHGDFINYIGIVMLAGVTVLCYIAIVPLLIRSRDVIYAVLAVIEVIVLLVAASGVIAVGH